MSDFANAILKILNFMLDIFKKTTYYNLILPEEAKKILKFNT